MNTLIKSCLIITTVLLSIKTKCQDTDKLFDNFVYNSHIDSVCGNNPILLNGCYSELKYYRSSGHQYIYSEEFIQGSITLNNNIFLNCYLNYDILNQRVFINYIDRIGSRNIIELSNAWIKEFVLGTKRFEILKENNNSKKIFQTIGNGSIQILYFWRKEYKMDNFQTTSPYYFTDPIKQCYIKINDQLYPFKNNRQFVKALKDNYKDPVKKYLKANNLNIALASYENLVDLINYCNNLIVP